MSKKENISDAINRASNPKKIGRSIVFTVCEGTEVVAGKPLGYVDTLLGYFTAERATAYLRRETGNQSITITTARVYKQYCQMDLQDFWLESKATSDPELWRISRLNESKGE